METKKEALEEIEKGVQEKFGQFMYAEHREALEDFIKQSCESYAKHETKSLALELAEEIKSNVEKDEEISKLTALAQNGQSAIDTNKRLAVKLVEKDEEIRKLDKITYDQSSKITEQAIELEKEICSQ